MMKSTGTARDFQKNTEVTTGEFFNLGGFFVASWILGLHSHRIEMDDFDNFATPIPHSFQPYAHVDLEYQYETVSLHFHYLQSDQAA